jgi:hypothetical protein
MPSYFLVCHGCYEPRTNHYWNPNVRLHFDTQKNELSCSLYPILNLNTETYKYNERMNRNEDYLLHFYDKSYSSNPEFRLFGIFNQSKDRRIEIEGITFPSPENQYQSIYLSDLIEYLVSGNPADDTHIYCSFCRQSCDEPEQEEQHEQITQPIYITQEETEESEETTPDDEYDMFDTYTNQISSPDKPVLHDENENDDELDDETYHRLLHLMEYPPNETHVRKNISKMSAVRKRKPRSYKSNKNRSLVIKYKHKSQKLNRHKLKHDKLKNKSSGGRKTKTKNKNAFLPTLKFDTLS